MSDEQYLMDYPVTVDNVEEWLRAFSELLTGQSPDEYRPRHAE